MNAAWWFFGMFRQWRSLEIIPNGSKPVFVDIKLGGINIHQPAISGQLPRGFDPWPHLKPSNKNLELHDSCKVIHTCKLQNWRGSRFPRPQNQDFPFRISFSMWGLRNPGKPGQIDQIDFETSWDNQPHPAPFLFCRSSNADSKALQIQKLLSKGKMSLQMPQLIPNSGAVANKGRIAPCHNAAIC